MTTTVRIREEDKRALEQLQAQITDATGTHPSVAQLLHRLIELGMRQTGELLDPNLACELDEEDKQQVRSATHDLGVETSEEDIDDILYGGTDGPA